MFLYLVAFVVIALIIFETALLKPLNDSLHASVHWSLLRNRALRNETALNNNHLRESLSRRSSTGSQGRECEASPIEIRSILNKAEKLSNEISKKEIDRFANSDKSYTENISGSEKEKDFVFDVANTSLPIESTSSKIFKQDNNKEHLLETLRNSIQQQTFLKSNHLYDLPLTESKEKDTVQNVIEAINDKVPEHDDAPYDLD